MNRNSLSRFERLAQHAANEPPFAIDVADRVMQTLTTQPVSRPLDRDLAVFGAASLVAASLALSLLWMGTTDETLLPLVQPFVTVLP